MAHFWGAIPDGATGWKFALWSPSANHVAVELQNERHLLEPAADGWWQAATPAAAGTSYRFLVDGKSYPDPASRLQAGDVHGQSVLIDHESYRWTTQWRGRPWAEAVIYELHVGTFTPEGTFAAAAEKLPELANLGITAIEIMPIGQWSGRHGWGYDGVLPFAPHPAYGTPDALKALLERAHSLGMMVILDLVMNHFGPEGSYIHTIAPNFFDEERHTPWGAAIDFSQPAVRRFWIECAAMWLTHYRFDGLRLDAIHQITGPGADDFLREFSRALRALPLEWPIHLVAEDERNDPQLRETARYDASWNDDFHHAVHTALTGESQGYYASFAVDPIGDLCLALERGHIEEGQPREGLKKPRGKPSGHLQPTAFVNAIQTHDQVGNRPHGDRLLALADPQAIEVAYALLLVNPYIPMIFMGEERGETAPFLYFADYQGELGQSIREGRAAEFPEIAARGEHVPDPTELETFTASKLTWRSDENATRWLALTRRCLAFRHRHLVPLLKSGRIDKGSVTRIGKSALTARWRFAAGTLELALNFGEIGSIKQSHADPQLAVNNLARDAYALSVQVKI